MHYCDAKFFWKMLYFPGLLSQIIQEIMKKFICPPYDQDKELLRACSGEYALECVLRMSPARLCAHVCSEGSGVCHELTWVLENCGHLCDFSAHVCMQISLHRQFWCHLLYPGRQCVDC